MFKNTTGGGNNIKKKEIYSMDRNQNKFNIPIIIAITFLAICIICIILALGSDIKNYKVIDYIIIYSWAITKWTVFIICPIGLIFQVKNKKRNPIDTILLIYNIIFIFIFYSIFIINIIFFPNNTSFNNEHKVRKQIKAEHEILKKEWNPVINYIEEYNKKNNKYPNNINTIAKKTKTFYEYEYETNSECNKIECMHLRVYPKKGPIEYYEYGGSYTREDWKCDSAIDDIYYYNIDENWMAVKHQLWTRHSLFWIIINKL